MSTTPVVVDHARPRSFRRVTQLAQQLLVLVRTIVSVQLATYVVTQSLHAGSLLAAGQAAACNEQPQSASAAVREEDASKCHFDLQRDSYAQPTIAAEHGHCSIAAHGQNASSPVADVLAQPGAVTTLPATDRSEEPQNGIAQAAHVAHKPAHLTAPQPVGTAAAVPLGERDVNTGPPCMPQHHAASELQTTAGPQSQAAAATAAPVSVVVCSSQQRRLQDQDAHVRLQSSLASANWRLLLFVLLPGEACIATRLWGHFALLAHL